MDQDKSNAADPILDEIAEIFEKLLESPVGNELAKQVKKLSEVVGKNCSANLSLLVDIFDNQRENSLPLLSTGISASEGLQPHRIWGDSSLHRYVIDGEIQVVPHDRCPKCWNVWDFKLQNSRCGTCDAEMGNNCTILLDSDACPNCEEGKVTASQPKCSLCGFEVNPLFVTWG